MDDLNGRVALVTGASGGIGRDIARALAQAGCNVAVGYKGSAEGARATVTEIEALGRRAVALAADVSDGKAAGSLVSEAEAALGPLSVLVNNAGINPVKSLREVTEADWERTIRVNLTSAFLVTQAALPGMRSRRFGRLVFLSSVAAQLGGVIGPHYAASKAGLIGLSHSYASLLAAEGITSNAIAPALVETDMIRGNSEIQPSLIPVGRFGQVDEVSSVAVMLASNGYVTGQTINVNGGWYMS